MYACGYPLNELPELRTPVSGLVSQCSTCAMVNELIEELVRKHIRDGVRETRIRPSDS